MPGFIIRKTKKYAACDKIEPPIWPAEHTQSSGLKLFYRQEASFFLIAGRSSFGVLCSETTDLSKREENKNENRDQIVLHQKPDASACSFIQVPVRIGKRERRK